MEGKLRNRLIIETILIRIKEKDRLHVSPSIISNAKDVIRSQTIVLPEERNFTKKYLFNGFEILRRF